VKRSEKSVEITFQPKHCWYTKSFTGGGYSRGRGRNQRERGRSNFGSNYGDDRSVRRFHSYNRLGHAPKNCWYKGETRCFNCKGFGHLAKDYSMRNIPQGNIIKDREGMEACFILVKVATETRMYNGSLIVLVALT
jgi:hypothetical protein